MKTIKQLLITIAVLLCSTTLHAHDFNVDGIYYNITSYTDLTVKVTFGGYYVDDYYNEYSGSIVIPSTVSYSGEEYSVTSIGYGAFYDCSGLTSITIPESVTSIGDNAFSRCSGLTSITIPESVTSIGDGVFSRCSGLTSITIPESVTSIGVGAFFHCSGLTSITIPESVTSIGDDAFQNCTSLNDLHIEDGNTTLDLGYDVNNGSCNIFDYCPLETIYLGRNLSYNERSSRSPFYDHDKLKSLTIGNSVTSIGDYAFENCYGLTSITISESVTSIGYEAFYGCGSGRLLIIINYSHLHLVAGSSDHGYVAYYAKKVINVNELTTLNNFQFITSNDVHYLVNYTGNDTEITLPDNYNGENYIIGDCAFYGCCNLTLITIPASLTYIGDYAFYNCTSLKDIRIEDGDTTLELGKDLFYNCPLESVHLGRNLSNDKRPFHGINTLCSVVIGPKVTHIGDNAFNGCDNIHSLTINSGVVSIGLWAFSTPDKVIWLTNTPPEGYYNAHGRINYVANEQYTSLDNVHVYPYLSSIFETDGVKHVPVSPSERTCHAIDCAYDSTATTINVGETVLFQGVEMNVTEVMPFTFYGNSHIKDVSVSHSGNIGNQAFCYCDNLVKVEISNHGDLGNQAFCYCDNLVKVEISNYGDIGYEAFYSCDSLGTAIISNYGNIGESVFHGCSSLKNVTLGNNVSSLGNEAFYQCVSLQEIVIPESIDTISDSCFEGCSALANVDLGQGVNVINKYAFQDCSALTNVNLRECVSIIDDNTFEGCSSLSQISIPKSVKEIGDNVFKGCTALSDIIIEDRNEILSLGSNGSSALFADCPLDSLYIGGKITYETSSYYGYSPFYRNTSLRTVVVTNKEDQIYDNEFYGCSNLKNVIIGHGVESIGDYAFSGCSSLDGFSFGSNLKTIGAEAFSDCTNITSITSHAEVPPTCGEQALDDINKWTCVLKVPQNYASAYQAADQWKEFFYIEDVVEIELFTITYIVDGEVYATEKYAVGDEIIPEEEPVKEGYTFNGWSEIPKTMPAHDVTVTGSFSINSYDLVYMVDGEEYKRVTVKYGSKITPEKEPVKEGYTFSGWSNIPETMPARNVTVTGSFSINSYDLVYMIDGEEYKRVTLKYGSKITPEKEPEKEGYTFSGWSEIPETMPAHDVEVTGSFIPTNVSEITAEVSLQINGNNISLSNANNSTVAIYSINGMLVKKIDKYAGEEIALEKGVYIVSVGDKAMKIIL